MNVKRWETGRLRPPPRALPIIEEMLTKEKFISWSPATSMWSPSWLVGNAGRC